MSADFPPGASPASAGLPQAMLELAQLRPGDDDPTDVLIRIASAALAVVPAADVAGVTLRDAASGGLTSIWSSGPLAVDVDGLQNHHGEGPTLDVLGVAAWGSVAAAELASDPRWPTFGPSAAARGAHSALALALSVEDSRGDRPGEGVAALSLYAEDPDAFDLGGQDAALMLMMYAALSLNARTALGSAATEIGQLKEAIATRNVIGQAQGILMAQQHCDAQEAFALLKTHSQHNNRKLREVAAELASRADDAATHRIRPPAQPEPEPGPAPGAPRLLEMTRLSGLVGLHLTGEIDETSEAAFLDGLSGLLDEALRTGQDAHLELAGLTFVAARSATTLVRAAAVLGERGQLLVLHDAPPTLVRTIQTLWPDAPGVRHETSEVR